MPWNLRKFLTSKDQNSSSNGGDKGREKKDKSSKQGKSSKKRNKSSGKSTVETTKGAPANESYTEPLKTSKESLNTSGKADLSTRRSSDDASFVSGDLISSGHIRSDDDYKSVEEFSADCPNLTGYLETAILESACNTLERNHKTPQTEIALPEPDIDPYPVNKSTESMAEVAEDQGNILVENEASVAPLSESSSAFDAGLYVEYVNYDLLGTDGASGSSEEYFSSEDEAEESFLNSNNNSNRAVDVNSIDAKNVLRPDGLANAHSLRHGTFNSDGISTRAERSEGSSNNNSSYYGDEGSKNNTTEPNERRNSSEEVDRNETQAIDGSVASEKEAYNESIDCRPHEQSIPVAVKDENNTGRIINEHNYNIGLQESFREEGSFSDRRSCPIHNASNLDLNTGGDIQDMEKAKSIFGMCLCQNGEQVDNVTDLDFRNCNLKKVPHEIFQYAHTLTHLQLDSNTLSDLPKSLFSCDNLEYLTVSDNDLGLLPPTLAGLSNLKYLDISKNVIEDVPDCIKCCKNLAVLDASVNPIERLSDGFTQLVSLTELYLNDCFLEFLPANFGRLVQLTVLELRDNQLQILPKSIRRLSLLKRLDLGGNIFQEWPDVVCELRRLTELWLDGNELGKVPEQIGELTSLVYLDLSRNFIELLPSQIGLLRKLTDLLLCENHITYLPDTVGFLDQLTILKVSMNQLSRVPESIGKLRDIEELDLSHNKLEQIPSTIGNLTMMHTLLLDNNVLAFVPPELGGCIKLNVLQMSRNKLEAIPREVGELSELKVFNICRNRLSHLPITIIKLAQLEALWISSNQSKPNVPLHAELGPDGKTRILTNILFPQLEQDNMKSRLKTDEDGYANDAADDDEPPLFRKQRGVTRVAFNLEPVCHHEDMNMSSDEEYHENGDMVVDIPVFTKDQNSNDKFPLLDGHANSIDVSDALMSNNGLHIQPTSLSVRSPDTSMETDSADVSHERIPIIDVSASFNGSSHGLTNGMDEYTDFPPPSYDELRDVDAPSMASDVPDGTAISSTLPGPSIENSSNGSKSYSVPDLRKTPLKDREVEDTTKSSPAIETLSGEEDSSETPKIKTWSSHSHLPAIQSSESLDDVHPVAADIISNRSSSSQSLSQETQEERSKLGAPKVGRLPIPSQAIFDQADKRNTEPSREIKVDTSPKPPRSDPLADIPFMDSEMSDESEASALKTAAAKPPKKAKPPPPPRSDSLLSKTISKHNSKEVSSVKPPVPSSKPSLPSSSGLKIFTPAFLQKQRSQNSESSDVNDALLPPSVDDRPPSDSPPDGMPHTDGDSGVGNDVDSQESIPECADEEPTESNADVSQSLTPPKTTVKSIARFQVADVRDVAPKPPPASQPPPIAPKPANLPNKISASIKMFENISSSPEHKAQQPSTKSLADLLPTGPRKTEEKAIIRPNNHLNDSVVNKQALEPQKASTDSKFEDISPVKVSDFSDIVAAEQPVMFLRDDDDVMADASAFSKALTELTSSPERKRVSRSRSDSSESSKQNQFRERLEKIMQQQKNVSAATKVAQNGAALSLSRKTSFNTNSQPTSPDGSGLEKLTAENSFPIPDYLPSPISPDYKSPTKKQSVSDRMKSKLDRGSSGPAVKSASSSKLSRTRPGSAPAAQLLQRRNSNQRNSIAAPENSYDEKRTLAPLYGNNENTGLDPRSRTKSIEQQLGQLLLDSDEERLNRDERLDYERRHDDMRREQHRLKKDSSGIRGSRNSLCSPPPVRHNMYAKARSSTNASVTPLADWKHKLLQHVERKRLEKQQLNALQQMGRVPRTQQPQRSIGKIKSPPRTSGPGSKQQHLQSHSYYDGSNYVAHPHAQSRREPSHAQYRSMGNKAVTAPALMAAPKMVTNTHVYKPEGQGVRSHFAGNSRAAKLAKQRTFTPGPENHGNSQMMVPRPKSAMDKFTPQHQMEPSYAEPPSYRQQTQQPVLYADLRTYKQPPLPTYEDYLHRRAVPYQQEPKRVGRSESTRKSFRGSNNHGHSNYDDIAAYPLRQSGSHESLMDAARYNQQQHDAYFPSTPLRNASSHDSVLDQPPYQAASYAAQYYSPPQQQRYPANHIPQRYPVADKRNKYNSPDYATYVNVYEYGQSPVEYHNQPQLQEPYQSRLGYRGSARNKRPQQQTKQDQASYGNYAYPPNYRENRPAPNYEQHYRQQREPLSPTLYRPLAEREDGSVASAFRPYHQQQPQRKPHHHNPYIHPQSYELPQNQALSPTDYKNGSRHMSPPSNYQYMPEQSRHVPRHQQGWPDGHEDFERVTVSVRRNPTFGFHVTGGIGAGGNQYRPMDDGVFVTHVSQGGAADNKLQAGDKILMVNGSDFIGISHQRAVDLLRNAGKVAVLVVERSLGKPV